MASFTENTNELRKIIKENIWFGSNNQEIALEFLDAIIWNHKMDIETLDNSHKVYELENKIEDLEQELSIIENTNLITVDIGIGEFTYCKDNLNLKFTHVLECLIEQFKNGN